MEPGCSCWNLGVVSCWNLGGPVSTSTKVWFSLRVIHIPSWVAQESEVEMDEGRGGELGQLPA